jgi:hypothetical protein
MRVGSRFERNMMKRIAGTCAVLACAGLFMSVAGAQYRDRPGRGWHGDIRHFHERDFVRWRGGRWVHGWHGRSFGWWWVVGGVYYAYPTPVYPYPDPYTPPAVVVAPPPVVVQAPAPGPAVVIQTPTPAPAAAPPPPAPAAPAAQAGQPGTWYYCDSPQGYYPYVPQCNVQWRAVPASPPPG